MKIGVDARELLHQPTGVGTYLDRLLREWQQTLQGRAHQWLLYVPQSGRRDGNDTPGPGTELVAEPLAEGFRWRPVAGQASTWWEQTRLAAAVRRDRPDVLFAPGYTAPLALGGVPTVLTIHDVSYFVEPRWFRRREGLRRRVLTRLSARRARTILTDAQCSKADIVHVTGCDADRVRVVYAGIERPATPRSPDGRPPVVLFVGSIFNRRRVPDLVRAFAAIVTDVPGATLEVVGYNRSFPHEDISAVAQQSGVGARVRVRDYVSTAELEALYDRARAFAFLSEYEGFGFTPLEALAHNVPIVVLDTPVAREIYQDAAVFVPAGDTAGTSLALKWLLQDRAARSQQLERAPQVLDRYRWADAAAATLSAIESAAGLR